VTFVQLSPVLPEGALSFNFFMYRIMGIAREYIDDTNSYTSISHLLWKDPETGYRGIITRVQAFDFLVGNPWCLYIEEPSGMRHYLMPATNDHGIYHVRTVADDIDSDEVIPDPLLDLPEFI
jgi:hypothetical protein